jgi:hypothetical protein
MASAILAYTALGITSILSIPASSSTSASTSTENLFEHRQLRPHKLHRRHAFIRRLGHVRNLAKQLADPVRCVDDHRHVIGFIRRLDGVVVRKPDRRTDRIRQRPLSQHHRRHLRVRGAQRALFQLHAETIAVRSVLRGHGRVLLRQRLGENGHPHVRQQRPEKDFVTLPRTNLVRDAGGDDG